MFSKADEVVRFALAGNARVTLVSRKSGKRYTYRIKRAPAKKEGGPDAWWVSVLVGPENTKDYLYMGTIWEPGFGLTRTSGSKVTEGDPRWIAFSDSWDWLVEGEMPPGVEVWHDGRCGRCGRELTVPESVASGLGPECAKK